WGRVYGDASAAERKRGEDMDRNHRYNPACAAAGAAAGKGEDATKLDEKERARLRRLALDWLRADLAAYTRNAEIGNPNIRQTIGQRLTHWQGDADLAGVRAKAALDKLPPD